MSTGPTNRNFFHRQNAEIRNFFEISRKIDPVYFSQNTQQSRAGDRL